MGSRVFYLVLGLPLWLSTVGCAWIGPDDQEQRYDVDGDGVPRPDDCDDSDPSITQPLEWWADADGDGFGDAGQPQTACAAPDGYANNDDDCDDTRSDVSPAGAEVCDGHDNDCDGLTDDDDELGADATWWIDDDQDGVGGGEGRSTCSPGANEVPTAGDCDDTDATRSPELDERCNGIDDDCDGVVDEDDAVDAQTWFRDDDGDGFGDGAQSQLACSRSAGFVPLDGDCDDAAFGVNLLAPEFCDGIDNNCNLAVDADDPYVVDAVRVYPDADTDGYGDTGASMLACTVPTGMVVLPGDCDDTDSSVRPGANEVCGGKDDDCDGLIDDDDPQLVPQSTPSWFLDGDGDGAGRDVSGPATCAQPAGYAPTNDDCDDGDPSVHPGAPELCDGRDNDCNGTADDGQPTWYQDDDGDGYGRTTTAQAGCTGAPGTVPLGGDCDDTDPAIHPGAAESCDGVDRDCDGLTDHDDPDSPAPTGFLDEDLDGWGGPIATSCAVGVVSIGGDCDDTDAAVSPGADEECDGIDNDCDGRFDSEDSSLVGGSTWYSDADGDGFGGDTVRTGCVPPPEYVATAGDCDDGSAQVNPSAIESCNGIDDDCDGDVDDADADVDITTFTDWFADSDGDGWGDVNAVAGAACEGPAGSVDNDQDCDDSLSTVSPTAFEICDDIDNDCDGDVDENLPHTWYGDLDGDGFGDPGLPSPELRCQPEPGEVQDNTDCNDGDPLVNTAATEECNGIDDDCDTLVDEDDPGIFLTAWGADQDGDGFGSTSGSVLTCTGPTGWLPDTSDCNDGRDDVHPGAPEVCDGADNDCDGKSDTDDPDVVGANTWYGDQDADGFGSGAAIISCAPANGRSASDDDCDDTDFKVHPSATELCDGTDNDCDGQIDEGWTPDGSFWFADTDQDGFGDTDAALRRCEQPSGYVLDDSDCDDSDPWLNPGLLNCVCGSFTGADSSLAFASELLLGDDADAELGHALAVGDLDADGRVDLLASAPLHDGGGLDGGRVWLIPGAADGLDFDGALVFDGYLPGQQAGIALAAYDVDLDGIDDAIVGLPGEAPNDAGEVAILLGPLLTGASLADADISLTGAAPSVETGHATLGVGSHLAVGGDIDNPGSQQGAVALFALPLVGSTTVDQADVLFIGESANDRAGEHLTPVGDLDGDGLDDLVVPAGTYGTGNPGAVYIELAPFSSGSSSLADSDGFIQGNVTDGLRFGEVHAGADTDQDGRADLLVEEWRLSEGAVNRVGAAHLFRNPLTAAVSTDAELRIEGTAALDRVGRSLANVGDLDCDGAPDFAVGAIGASGGGAVYIVTQPQTGVVPLSSLSATTWSASANGERAGSSVIALPDPDGDGEPEVVVGATRAGLMRPGAVYLLPGGAL